MNLPREAWDLLDRSVEKNEDDVFMDDEDEEMSTGLSDEDDGFDGLESEVNSWVTEDDRISEDGW
jgi:hypothetical protein